MNIDEVRYVIIGITPTTTYSITIILQFGKFVRNLFGSRFYFNENE